MQISWTYQYHERKSWKEQWIFFMIHSHIKTLQLSQTYNNREKSGKTLHDFSSSKSKVSRMSPANITEVISSIRSSFQRKLTIVSSNGTYIHVGARVCTNILVYSRTCKYIDVLASILACDKRLSKWNEIKQRITKSQG